MTLVSCASETSKHSAVIITSSYRSSPSKSSLRFPTSSSSSSGATTPVDQVSPVLVAFPRPLPLTGSLTSSGSSSLSLDKHRPPQISFPRAPLPFAARPQKLSLDSSKAKPIPAVPSASDNHSPLGAFSPTSSAECHLRSLVTRASHSDILSTSTISPNRLRTSSLRSLTWLATNSSHSPYDVDDDDSGEEAETFWPRRNALAYSNVPSISRSPPVMTSVDNSTSPVSQARPTSRRAASSPNESSPLGMAESKRPSHVRAKTRPSPSDRPHNKPILSPPASAHPSRAFLGPARSKGKEGTLPVARNADNTGRGAALSLALAAVEHASRLRARCVCGVCGKAGADFPRCPRCSATWCSRQCRISDAAAGSARHTCAGKSPIQANTRPMTIGL